jgi:hypothetical protein
MFWNSQSTPTTIPGDVALDPTYEQANQASSTYSAVNYPLNDPELIIEAKYNKQNNAVLFDTLIINFDGTVEERYKIHRDRIEPVIPANISFLTHINDHAKPISFGYDGTANLHGQMFGQRLGPKVRTIIQSLHDIKDINTYNEAFRIVKYNTEVKNQLDNDPMMSIFNNPVWTNFKTDNVDKFYSLVILVLSLNKNPPLDPDLVTWITNPDNNTPPATRLGYKYGIPRDIVITLNPNASMRSKLPSIWSGGSKTKKYRKRVTNRYRGNNRNRTTNRYRRNRTRR